MGPIVIVLTKDKNGVYSVVAHIKPSDGTVVEWTSFVKSIFPEEYHESIIKHSNSRAVGPLLNSIVEKKAKEYYGISQ